MNYYFVMLNFSCESLRAFYFYVKQFCVLIAVNQWRCTGVFLCAPVIICQMYVTDCTGVFCMLPVIICQMYVTDCTGVSLCAPVIICQVCVCDQLHRCVLCVRLCLGETQTRQVSTSYSTLICGTSLNTTHTL